jgi:hypothetical protein
MLAGAGLLVAGLLLGPFVPSWPALLPVWTLLGLDNGLVLTPSGRLPRRSAHAGDRPALFAAQFALSHACWLLTYPLAGGLGATIGLGPPRAPRTGRLPASSCLRDRRSASAMAALIP